MSSVALTPGMAALVLFGVFFALLVARVPVAFALGLACLPVVITEPRLSPMMLFNETFKAYNSFILLAVPFYLLTANLMNVGGVTDRLVRLSRSMVGHFPGALAQINVLLSVFFAGISGSSTADAASQSKIFIEAQTREGYDLSFSIAITAVSAVLAVIIPPSILMIVWGGVLSVSIGALYLAGILPGLLFGACLIGLVLWQARRQGFPAGRVVPLREGLKIALDAVWGLITIVIILGGILSGMFTAIESGAVACVYAFFCTMVIYKEYKWRELPKLVHRVTKTVAMVMMVIGFAAAFGYLMAIMQLPAKATAFFLALTDNKYVMLLLINILLLLLGTFMDMAPMILICTPIMLPVVKAMGVDPVHFGMIMLLNLGIGLITPPVGPTLFVGCAIGKVTMEEVSRELWPFYGAMCAALLIVTYFPGLSLWLPRVLGY